jgi:hypothetical protein
MSKKCGTKTAGAPLSAVLELCKKTAAKCRQFAARVAHEFRLVRQENPRELARATDASHTSFLDFAGRPTELSEFIKVLRIGDRIRVFCDDGVVLAEKISQTQFKEIHIETRAKLVH